MQDPDSLIEIIDEKGGFIGTKKREEIDKKKDIFKTVYIVVYNSIGEIYVVELTGPDSKNSFYQKYSVSASGIVRHGETAEEAAERTLKRELNIDNVDLDFLGKDFIIFNDKKSFANFFCLKYDSDIEPNPEDVEKGEFVSKEMIENMIYLDRDIYTPSFLEFWNRFRDKLK